MPFRDRNYYIVRGETPEHFLCVPRVPIIRMWEAAELHPVPVCIHARTDLRRDRPAYLEDGGLSNQPLAFPFVALTLRPPGDVDDAQALETLEGRQQQRLVGRCEAHVRGVECLVCGCGATRGKRCAQIQSTRCARRGSTAESSGLHMEETWEERQLFRRITSTE